MRVISLVPSWTETLLEAGVEVVGRSRYCIHPQEKVRSIPVVGGTKDLDLEKIKALKADVLLLDREENTQTMADSSPIHIVDTHVESISSLILELEKLSDVFQNQKLKIYSEQFKTLQPIKGSWSWESLPALKQWINPPSARLENFVYVIWKKPWMSVSHATFIGSMFEQLGGRKFHLEVGGVKYPQFELAQLDPQKSLLLFSSEPYPFEKHIAKLKELPFSSALVDGECMSWFGVRALKFLESQILRKE